MATQPIPRSVRNKNDVYKNNINKRGNVKTTLRKEPQKYGVGPIVLAVLVFIVIGGVFFEMFIGKKR
ncbi:hypothetical protein HDU97_004975 [Phlyctochytrium planicorne]|nr:hypothetical protein HDU97_004975 [Phlyctochytrium planicorne]